MNLLELFKEAWETAEEKGWHEQERPVPESIALLHSDFNATRSYRHGGKVC